MKLLAALAFALTFAVGAPTATAARVPVSGTLTIEATSDLSHGGHFDATMVTTGRLAHGASVYTSVVLQQATIVYLWSAPAPYFSFPLVQQIGFASQGLLIDPTVPAAGSASLIYRVPSGKGYTYTFLATVTFTVTP